MRLLPALLLAIVLAIFTYGTADKPRVETYLSLGIALVTSFAAREVMVSTMATMFNLSDTRDDVVPLRTSLREATNPVTGKRSYSALTGISLMVFFVLACQCMSTVAVVRRETNSWRWPIFMLVLMNAMAWLASFAVYQGGRMLGYGA